MSARAVIAAAVRMSGAVIAVGAACTLMSAGIRVITRVTVVTGIMPAGVVQDSQEIDKGNPYPKNGQGGIEDK
jgi:hypothetical protein